MRQTQSIAEQISENGFAVVEDVLSQHQVDVLSKKLANAGHGKRNLFEQVPQTRSLVTDPAIASLVASILGDDAFAVRALLFDKLEGANWHVGWHQDQAIAIQERVDAPGFGPTSMKHGVPHTRASADILQNMLAVRIHLDDCGPHNGPLRCVPGSHLLGRLDPDDSLKQKQRLGETICTVGLGGVLLMRPLCLHASSPAQSPSHRRVIHIEFAGCELPGPLQWYERKPIRHA
ncbi:MAG: phytanoyl-CoA dioxygenase family protein [Phycisphaeraceae bacterium]